MGAGILPTTIHNGKLYFLFGKEGKYEDSAPGFSDFGGGTDNNETFFETAIREAGEELTGFLGNNSQIRKILKTYGTYNIDFKSNGHNTYRMHIFPYEYNYWLPYFYNNNQKFIQKYLPTKILKNTKIFEKAEIKWVCIDELHQMRTKFRSYFQNIVDMIINQKENIFTFITKSQKKRPQKKTQRKKIYKNKKTKSIRFN
jgi:hypothetical protein